MVRTWWRRVSLGGGAVTCMGQVIRSREKITCLLHYNCLPSRTQAPPSVQRCVDYLVGFLWQAIKNLLTQWELRRKTDSSRSMKNPKTWSTEKGKNEGKTDSRFYGGLVSSRLMLRLLPHVANGSTALPLAVNIGRDSALGYWQGQIYGRRGCYWFIGVVLMEGANQFPEVLHCWCRFLGVFVLKVFFSDYQVVEA